MAICALTGKKQMKGHKVSHSNIKTKRACKPNIKKKRVFDMETGRFVRLALSTRALRTLNHQSLSTMVRKILGSF
ncbi:MAG: 50S ribosomal protein L28 [Myxococcales bacterium]|nr:50S ribosomal protein L28 [Myxococcales bacterium]USN49954.1 MAG: 50S ribosomal protein L28 [Myxococcales bacterium]